MLFETGFLGTGAPLYLDVITLYFSFLPFMLAGSILFAIGKQYERHYRSQIAIFIVTVVMVLLFEIGMRIDGGFMAYMKEGVLSMALFSIFLAVHIAVAVISVILWTIVLHTSLREYKAGVDMVEFARRHKRKSRLLFGGLTFTSITGVMIYLFLFVW